MMQRTTHQAQGLDESQIQGFFMISKKASDTAIVNRLTGSQFRLWHYLMSIQPFADQTSDGDRIYRDSPSPADIGVAIGANRKTVEKDMRRLKEVCLWESHWPKLKACKNLERTIRDRLQFELGGLTEVSTPAGRIDLLTDTEIIEFKAVSDWKSAIGQVLAYSGFYPEYQKRIHLFAVLDSSANEQMVCQARAICNELGVAITFEEVQA